MVKTWAKTCSLLQVKNNRWVKLWVWYGQSWTRLVLEFLWAHTEMVLQGPWQPTKRAMSLTGHSQEGGHRFHLGFPPGRSDASDAVTAAVNFKGRASFSFEVNFGATTKTDTLQQILQKFSGKLRLESLTSFLTVGFSWMVFTSCFCSIHIAKLPQSRQPSQQCNMNIK